MTLKPEDFFEGEQVIYVPSHIDNKDIHHPACEKGFVTSHNDHYVFCRFFYKDLDRGKTLRTTANSEACNPADLHKFQYCPQVEINRLITLIKRGDA